MIHGPYNVKFRHNARKCHNLCNKIERTVTAITKMSDSEYGSYSNKLSGKQLHITATSVHLRKKITKMMMMMMMVIIIVVVVVVAEVAMIINKMNGAKTLGHQE